MGDQIIMFISQIFNGLKIGSVYSLVALGYTMVYGIIRLINFAHGDFIMVGSYVLMLTIPAIVAFGLPAWVAVIPAILMCVAVGVIVERAAYKPVREKGNSMTALITAIAMSLLLENGSQAIFGADYQTVPTIIQIPTLAIGKLKIDQVCIGSCTNSSLLDMMKVAHILKGKTVNPDVSLAIAPGSKQVLNMMADMGILGTLIAAGARILESACGPCIGMGQSPNSGGISLRTFNRNFLGRSGTKDGQIYLVSPELAAYSALTGYLSDPRELGEMPDFVLPEKFSVNDNMIVLPAPEEEMDKVEILRGPNIKPFPETAPLEATIKAGCSLKVGDNITTDHIMPAGAKILPLRSNIPAISQHCFTVCDEAFPSRAKEMGQSIIVGGSNYGQGSSREHAALAPLYLGVKAVLVKSFARIHRANLINAGILPLTFVNEADYEKISQGDVLELADIRKHVEAGETTLTLVNKTTGAEIPVLCELTGRTKDIILAGGLLDYTRDKLSK